MVAYRLLSAALWHCAVWWGYRGDSGCPQSKHLCTLIIHTKQKKRNC